MPASPPERPSQDDAERLSVEEAQALATVEAGLFGRPREPVRLARFVLLERIGSGGAGTVFAAYDPQLDRKVALKLLHSQASRGEGESEARARLLREAQAIAKLSHPNVVTVHDVATYDGALHLPGDGEDRAGPLPARGVFVVMEYIDGPTLTDWLRERDREVREILAVFDAAGRGLAAAHARGIVHRDFKPANVMIGADHRVRVLDFGIARMGTGHDEASVSAVRADDASAGDTAADDVTTVHAAPPSPDALERSLARSRSLLDSSLTHPGTVMGTPAYMAPEQHRGEPAGPAADQFAFCSALYEALVGAKPFAGKLIGELRTAKESGAIRIRPDPPPASRVPGHVYHAVLRGLEPRPEDRHPSMDALLEALSADPRRRATKRLLAGAAVIVAVSVVGIVWSQRSHEMSACADTSARLVGVWDHETQARIEQAFAASGVVYGADAWKAVDHGLSRYAEQWTEQRTQVCRARVSGTDPAEVLERRRVCLERRFIELEELGRALAEADADVVARSVEAVDGLAPLAHCKDDEALLESALPPEGALRDAVERVHALLARGRASAAAGHATKALSILEQAREAADETGHGPTRARAILALARAANDPGADTERAKSLAYEAWSIAEEAGDAFAEIDALTLLVGVAGYERAELDEARRLVEVARAKIRHAGGRTAHVASLDYSQGLVEIAAGRFDAATTAFERALPLREESEGASSLSVAGTHNALGAALIPLNRLEEAQFHLEEAERIYRSRLGDKHPTVASPLMNLGNVAFARGAYERWVELMREAVAIQEAAYGPDHIKVANSLNNLGNAYLVLQRYQDALATYERAARIYAETPDERLSQQARLRSNMGVARLELGQTDEALEELGRAAALQDRVLEPSHPDRALVAANRGLAHLLRKEPEAAKRELERAVKLWEGAFGPDHPGLAEPLRGLAGLALAEGHHDGALRYLERSLTLAKGPGSERLELARTRFALAQVIVDRDPERALELARAAQPDLEKSRSARDDPEKLRKWLALHGAR